jgi:hypothetical protein
MENTIENTIELQCITKEQLLEMYLESLSQKERKSYEIAKSHLGMSFDLAKSVGFIQWAKTQK